MIESAIAAFFLTLLRVCLFKFENTVQLGRQQLRIHYQMGRIRHASLRSDNDPQQPQVNATVKHYNPALSVQSCTIKHLIIPSKHRAGTSAKSKGWLSNLQSWLHQSS